MLCHEQSARPRIPIEEAEHPEEEAGADAVGGDRQPPVVVDELEVQVEVEVEGVDVDVEQQRRRGREMVPVACVAPEAPEVLAAAAPGGRRICPQERS